jgi:Amidohydrolase family
MNKPIAALLLCCGFAFGQPQSAIAIRNAKIVTVSGPVIPKGTVVVRNGLIEAVGENAAVPPDALIVEGEGLTVYPGLFDSLSTVGQPAAAAAPATTTNGRGGRGQQAPATTPTTPANPLAALAAMATTTGPVARGPEDRPQTTSWVKIADEVSGTDRRIDAVRSAGFTTVASFPTKGIFAGQGAIIDLLTDGKAGEMVVASPAGQYISVTRAGGFGGGFPSSLMGYIAYIRQLYIDMEHYKLVKDTYAKNPRGMQRPEYDRALEGLLDSPRILLPANRAVEIERMLRLAQELKQPTVIYGGRETYRDEAIASLKKYNAPVLVSMKWPEKARDTDPDDIDSMRTLETRDKAASAPAALKKAGVKFALYSDGVEQTRDLQRAVKKAIDAGLSREDALRALTLSPAEIFGVADRVGSIEKGKIGNLVVTRGEIFDDRTKVELIVVDGRKYTPAAETAPMGGRGPMTEEPGNQGGNR